MQDFRTTDTYNMKIKKRVYGLKKAAVLVFDNLIKNLSSHGYKPVSNTIGILHHTKRCITFFLCVNDFGVKYYSKDNTIHLLDSLSEKYTYTVDW